MLTLKIDQSTLKNHTDQIEKLLWGRFTITTKPLKSNEILGKLTLEIIKNEFNIAKSQTENKDIQKQAVKKLKKNDIIFVRNVMSGQIHSFKNFCNLFKSKLLLD